MTYYKKLFNKIFNTNENIYFYVSNSLLSFDNRMYQVFNFKKYDSQQNIKSDFIYFLENNNLMSKC